MSINIRKKETKFQTREKRESGITLVALVITIIVLLILAGVTIVTLTGDNGILKKAGETKDTTIEAEGLERIQLAVMASRDENGINTTSLTENLMQINGLTDTNNKEISEEDKIILPKIFIINGIQYIINDDGNVEKIIEGRVPSIYQQVEYIESSGTQYIDTNFKGNQDTKITCESVISDEFKSGYYQGLFGATDVNVSTELNRNVIHMHRASASNLIIMAAYGNKIKIIGFSGDITKKHIYELDKNIYKVDNEIIYSYPMQTFMCTQNINIFRDNNSYTQDKRYCNMKLYSFKIYDNESLIRNFIPCYRNTDNIIGLYDTVEGKFYTNQGSGIFGYGMEDGTYVAPQNN